uniref:Serine hydroxymethyltransferase n=1 Tax=Solanum tuberosum TaxID=4113 RepID=M1DKJ6_SOLTU
MDTFQLFGSIFYIRPTIKLAKPLIDNESVISIRDPRISSKFWAITGFIVSATFANRPFDPGTHDIPLSYVANENMFRNSSFVSTYVLVVTLWGEQVCGLRRKHVGTTSSEQVINLLELLLALNLVSLDVSTGYSDCKQLEICDTLFKTKLIATNASASACRYVCSKQKVYLLADIAHISGSVASLVICSPFKYSTFVPIATQFMESLHYNCVWKELVCT